MLLKRILLFSIITFLFNIASAQKKQNVYFYKNNGKEVFSKDSADFIRIIQEPDSGALYFNLIELYPDGKKKTLGSVASFLPRLKYEGQLISYYPNGKRQRVARYENNKLIGPTYLYFANGVLHKTFEIKVFTPEKNKPFTHWADTLVMHQADSTGRVMVENGNGHITEQITLFKGTLVEGNYKDGLKHGFWSMKSNDGAYSNKEEYAEGKFISGESELKGIKSTYKTLDEMPTMKGGIQNFYNYLKRNIRYPTDAHRDNIEGKVFLSFNVEIDGSLSNIKVERGLHPSLDAEALRVLKGSPKWIPGRMRGLPVKVKFNIPVSFSLSNAPMFTPSNGLHNPPRF